MPTKNPEERLAMEQQIVFANLYATVEWIVPELSGHTYIQNVSVWRVAIDKLAQWMGTRTERSK